MATVRVIDLVWLSLAQKPSSIRRFLYDSGAQGLKRGITAQGYVHSHVETPSSDFDLPLVSLDFDFVDYVYTHYVLHHFDFHLSNVYTVVYDLLPDCDLAKFLAIQSVILFAFSVRSSMRQRQTVGNSKIRRSVATKGRVYLVNKFSSFNKDTCHLAHLPLFVRLDSLSRW